MGQKVEHIVIFKGRLVVLDFFVDRFIEYLEKMGIDYYLVNTNDPSTFDCKAFDDYVHLPNTVMFTFNNVGVSLYDNGQNLWKKHGIPVYTFIVDPPRAFADALTHPECDLYVLSLDENRNDFIREFYPEVKRVYFVPAAGADVASEKKLKDRNIDVIYMGSCQKSNQFFPALEEYEDGGSDLYNTVVAEMVSAPEITTEQAVRNYINRTIGEGNLTKDRLLNILINACKPIENTVRRYFKLMGMHALDREGICVDVWGDGWEDEEDPFSPNIRFHDRITPEELLHYCGDAKISLVYMGWQKRGCSEKNFDSMLNGCVCVTDENTYIKKHYVDGLNTIIFDMRKPDQMAADIKYLLEHLDVAQKIADEGYKTAMKYDSWEVRSAEIYKIMCDR